MKKSAVLALLLAMLMPFAGYYLVKYYSKEAVVMPRKYFEPDSIIEKKVRGKITTDTIWHKVRDVKFVNQLGKQVSLYDIKGKIIVLDFFFTRCPSICPGLARNMKRMQNSFINNDSIVQFISVSVDPEHDSVPQLRKFADRFNINHDTWWMVSGNRKEIYDFALQDIKASIADTNVDTAFIHTENFFLIDSNKIVRGWYNGFDTVALAKLARDIPLLMLEKDRTKPSFLRGFIPILPIIFIGLAIVFVVLIFLNRNKE